MNQDVKERWVAALRSGKYKQGNGMLRIDGAFCCLGVLCDVVNPSGWGAELPMGSSGHVAVYFGEQTAGLTPEVMALAGLDCDLGDRVSIDGERDLLSTHNDCGKTFEQIADAIEAQL